MGTLLRLMSACRLCRLLFILAAPGECCKVVVTNAAALQIAFLVLRVPLLLIQACEARTLGFCWTLQWISPLFTCMILSVSVQAAARSLSFARVVSSRGAVVWRYCRILVFLAAGPCAAFSASVVGYGDLLYGADLVR